MNTEYTLQATKRENRGTSSSKKIRKNNGIRISFLPKASNSDIGKITNRGESTTKIK